MLDAAFAAAPDGGCLPGAAAVHDDHRGIVEAGVAIAAERMSEMMVDKAVAGFRGAKLPPKGFSPPCWCCMLAKWRVEFRTFRYEAGQRPVA